MGRAVVDPVEVTRPRGAEPLAGYTNQQVLPAQITAGHPILGGHRRPGQFEQFPKLSGRSLARLFGQTILNHPIHLGDVFVPLQQRLQPLAGPQPNGVGVVVQLADQPVELLVGEFVRLFGRDLGQSALPSLKPPANLERDAVAGQNALELDRQRPGQLRLLEQRLHRVGRPLPRLEPVAIELLD